MTTKHPPGPPMTLGNRREMGAAQLSKQSGWNFCTNSLRKLQGLLRS